MQRNKTAPRSQKEIRLTHAKLIESLWYCKDSGEFTWLVDYGRNCVGDAAGYVSPINRRHIYVYGESFLASRLAWFYVTGAWPKHYIDHINRDPSDDRWCNIREATPRQNQFNRSIGANNTTRFKGVSRKREKFVAKTREAGKWIHIGVYDTAAEAGHAYSCAVRGSHGEFSS